MAGTREGGLKAAATNRKKHGKAFYASIGSKGGKATVTKGFGTNRVLASLAGSKGGRVARAPRITKKKSPQNIHVKFL